LSVAFDWLEDEGEDASLDVLTVKLDELREEGDKIEYRMSEAEERPKAITMLRYSIMYTNESLYNESEKRNFTEEDFKRTVDDINDVKVWLEKKLAEQLKQPLNEDPALTTDDIDDKMEDLKYYLKYIRSRPLKKKPKKPLNETSNETSTNSTNTTEEGAENETGTPAEGESEEQKEQKEAEPQQENPTETNEQPTAEDNGVDDVQNDNEKKEL